MTGGVPAAMPCASFARGVDGASGFEADSRRAARAVGAAGIGRAGLAARFGQSSAIFMLGLLVAALYGAVLSAPDATRGLDGERPMTRALSVAAMDLGLEPPPGTERQAWFRSGTGTVVNPLMTIDYPGASSWSGARLHRVGDFATEADRYAEIAAIAAIAPAAGLPTAAPVSSLDLSHSPGSWLARPSGSAGFLIAAFADSVRSGAVAGLPLGGVPLFEIGADGEPHARLESVEALELYFDAVDYDLDDVRRGDELVPRRYVASLPPDLDSLESSDERKALFIKAVLPVVLRVNEDIVADRERLAAIAKRHARGKSVSLVDQIWLDEQFALYDVESGDVKELIDRVDIIPPSLAIAQAAEESGWGTSRFAREGNALFGQYTDPDGPGIMPLSRDAVGKYRIRSYDTLYETVRSYALNLNQHPAYEKFRDLRAELRASDGALDGHRLAGTLTRYSERGRDYVKTIRTIMRENALGHFDDVRLNEQMITLEEGRRANRPS